MAVCVYDNPATMRRECWDDGVMIYAYSAELLMAKVRPPIFFAANIGKWNVGQLVGEPMALTTRHNHERGGRTVSEIPLTTGEHKTLTLSSEIEILLARRIDTLEHVLSLKEGGYSPHRIAMDNFGLIDENNQLRSRVEALESVVWELVQACGCEEENKRIIEVMHIPKNGGPPTFSDPEEHCPVCTKALALLAPPANEATDPRTQERKGGE